MHSHHLIGRVGGRGGLPRRRLLQGAGALGLATTLRPTAVFAEREDEGERLGPFGPWSTPVNLGPVVNTQYDDSYAAISKNGLSLYINSDRPGGVNGKSFTGFPEIWVSQRASLDADWGPPVNLDAFNRTPVINVVGYGTAVPSFSADGHLLLFNSNRPGGLGGIDLYVSRRSNKHDDFGWQAPVNLSSVNSPQNDNAATYFEDEETGIISLYITTNRPGGPVGSASDAVHIWVSTLGDDGSFGPPVLVPELSSRFTDNTTDIRRDGLEFFLVSTRPSPDGRTGLPEIWVSTRDNTRDPWSTPVNLGPTVNTPGYTTGRPSLSSDGTTLYFYSDRPGGFGRRDLYVTSRRKLREHERPDDSDHQRS
jgi:hypothetical protein